MFQEEPLTPDLGELGRERRGMRHIHWMLVRFYSLLDWRVKVPCCLSSPLPLGSCVCLQTSHAEELTNNVDKFESHKYYEHPPLASNSNLCQTQV